MSVLDERRRTYLRAEDRRAQILEVAKAVFVRRGYRVANVADICKEAGIGRGTLYQYFDSKQDVLRALMREIAERIRKTIEERPRVRDLGDVSGTPPALVAAFCRRRLREVLDAVFVDEPTLRLVLRDARGLDGVVDEILAEIDAVVSTALEADLRAAQAAGVFRAADPRLTARYLLGGIEKLVLSALADEGPVDLDGIVELVVDLELFGLLGKGEGR